MEKMSKNVIVFGGDGFCGWPLSLRLSNVGYNVTIVDNLIRRKTDVELECGSLTPISPISTRIEVWKELTGKEIRFEYIDVADHYHRILTLFKKIKPDVVVHYAEQRAAPYSMKSSYHKRYTLTNNLNATHYILCAIVESGLDIHLVHLGTTGVYGYGTAGMAIPEGYLRVKVDTDEGERELEIMYPASPGSVYHMTKTMDALAFLFYNKNDNVRVTDLHQGIVWGTHTKETIMDERLINRFDYDGDYGTVLNRFLMQASVGHPLTVYGTGGQTRAFIHMQDSVNCVKLAIENPPQKGERVKIFNQTTECHNVQDLAKKISKATGAEIRYYTNPRNEARRNDLKFVTDMFLELGLEPTTLDNGLMQEVVDIADKYKDRCDERKIITTSLWDKNKTIDLEGSKKPVR
jgi:UDP-sulfoquinovose synthase